MFDESREKTNILPSGVPWRARVSALGGAARLNVYPGRVGGAAARRAETARREAHGGGRARPETVRIVRRGALP
jgi:hypothetical protein